MDFGLFAMGASYSRKRLDGWYAARNKAADAMSRNDAMTAMTTIWEAICEYGRYMPMIAAPHLDWLARNMEKFFEAEDEHCTPVIDALLDDIASKLDVLRDVPIPYTYGFLKALSEHGADIALQGEAGENTSAYAQQVVQNVEREG